MVFNSSGALIHCAAVAAVAVASLAKFLKIFQKMVKKLVESWQFGMITGGIALSRFQKSGVTISGKSLSLYEYE